ncbi:hypothetical protein SEA_MISSDAISY_77 [Mycobacterium phage MissDaisy]|nr:hypothetical protein SEA_MISSDAISY_77 [Mycobacterium phage MissDaisy]
MRSEHRPTADERDAFTRWRHVLRWRPGERKAIKRRSHRRDRRVERQRLRGERQAVS